MERLHKVLAARGIASRRKAEQMIADGRVSVDGEVVTTQGFRVDPEEQEIRVDGRLVVEERSRYIVLNKPSGYITTASDERGRRTVMDLVDVPERIVPVGRLDRPTCGLLLLTNDGELAFRITHPRYELDKEYEILLDGHPPRPDLERLQRGVSIDGEIVRPDHVWAVRNEPSGTVLRLVIHEGRNRIVRRMMERIGYPVLRLERVRLGPIVLQGIPRGAWRDLTPGELEQLRQALKMDEESTEAQPRQRETPPRRRPGTSSGDYERVRRDSKAARSGRSDRRGSTSGTKRSVRDRDRRPGRVGQEQRRRGDRRSR
jgi:23S rRNA pseudouridine2605 synthase